MTNPNAPEANKRDWFDVGTLVLLFLTAAFTGFLWRSTQELVKDGRENAQRQIRAYVFARPYPWINNTVVGKSANTTLGIRNGGQTPAIQLHANWNLEFRERAPEPHATVFQKPRHG